MMMEREHPMWAGLWLAAAVVLAMLFVGHADVLPLYAQASRLVGQDVPLNRFVAAMAVMIIPGAFLASLPGRAKAKEQKGGKATWRTLLSAFAGGILLALGLGIAGGGMVAGWLFGGIGAWVFLLVAWLVGFFLLRMGGERA